VEPSLPGLCEFESDNDVLEITPSTKINDLLKAYPELVEVRARGNNHDGSTYGRIGLGHVR